MDLYHPQPGLDGSLPDMLRSYFVTTSGVAGYVRLTVDVRPRLSVESVDRSIYEPLTHAEAMDVIFSSEALWAPQEVEPGA